ncbi:hypothetical protein HYALB_00003746 [Hymenoscyphus albidus]|uniref:non-specific serine/threonine protein kinase n=1 Tax=Hymenoscyphus albidus TaxID=595503 RepID=A0A9N9QA89_9HELO|nr:hypothetical protein HYALB_00003746 [Hymenoscyphus albidus]
MSSAALQAAPHQPTSVSSHSPVAATANRPFTAGSSQSSRDPYYNQNNTSNASPSSNRRPSRRPSGNGASSNNNSQQSAQYYSQSGNGPNPNSPMTSRAPNNSNPSASPTITAAAASGYPVMAPGDHQRGVPPTVTPRTSSNRTSTSAAAPSASRRERYADASNSPRQAPGDDQQERSERQRSNGSTQVNGAGDDSRSRRRAQQQSGEALPHRPSGTRESRASQSASRPTAMAVQSPTALSREASEVLNRVIVSKPEVDLDRERERMAEAVPSSPPSDQTPRREMAVVGTEVMEENTRGSRSRHDHANTGKREKNSKFGDYYLGNTLGEGEFGKVKMGWKQEGGVQVAIKLIRRDSVGTNPTRLAKIYREIAILREISHPNIVRLHEMVETEKQIGIILEYASGGELFDYILNHRYLKDNAARRLFAQLVSGVGYLHKKGIVHRDLKLENLLLDRNRNIIITDFGFANTFSPNDELGDEIEYNLGSREYVKRMELDKILPNGNRRGDLMQTSCGSPCYAAPELVVSDSLYTGRKVDVWSCGVILYAMLAGYLPFDDDPANPEGDNINLLYKYIVSTPLTFPEYVTPHARDLLRRILVPDPRKRADLFEVARHSWLSEYSHVVGFITSSTTTTAEISSATVKSEEQEAPGLGRSSSVREPTKTGKAPAPVVGELGRKHGGVDPDAPESHPKPSKDNKRRTVQVEYVAPRSQTQRGEPVSAVAPSGSKTRARAGSFGPVEVQSTPPGTRRQVSTEKALPRDPPAAQDAYASHGRRPSTSQRPSGMPPPTRPGREHSRTLLDKTHIAALGGPPVSIARPNTGGSMTSFASRGGTIPLTNRGSYSQPAAPTVTGTNTHGRIEQPKGSKNYSISGTPSQDESSEYGRPSSHQVPPKFQKVAGMDEGGQGVVDKGHKRSNTISGFFSRTNSVFGKSGRRDSTAERPAPEKQKKYPPISMAGAHIPGHPAHEPTPRHSIDSRRSISFGFGKKRSGSINGSQSTLQEKPRRFSLLPASFSLKSIGIGKEYGTPGAPPSDYDSRPDSHGTGPSQSTRSDPLRNTSGSAPHPATADGSYDRQRDSPLQDRRNTSTASPTQHRYTSQGQVSNPRSGAAPQFLPPMGFRQGESAINTESESSLNEYQNQRGTVTYPQAPQTYPDYDSDRRPGNSRANSRGVLQKPNRKFAEAYEPVQNYGYGPTHTNDHAGSSGAARKVMDFFRRRGKDRAGER